MSNLGKFIDRNPDTRAAGTVTTILAENADGCIAPTIRQNATPANLRRFRRTSNDEPGAKLTHWGLANAPLPQASFAYGRKTYGSDHVHDVIKPHSLSQFQEFRSSVQELKYTSTVREPLGKSLVRNYNLPHSVSQPNFRYGMPVVPSEPLKQVLCPSGGSRENSEDAKALYYKSHGTTLPEEQIHRGYQWPIDPTKFRFGVRDNIKNGTAEEAFKPDLRQSLQVVSRTTEEFRHTTNDLLGRSKNLGTGMTFPTEHAFGQTHSSEEWGAGRCIQGVPSAASLLPDKDLGRSLRHGFRNVPKPGDEDRLFGVPSVRFDLPKKQVRSVDDGQNYGDEPTAVEVLFPDHWLRYGLSPDEFLLPRRKEEVRELLQGAGIPMGVGKFEAIYSKAQRTTGKDTISLRNWTDAYKWFTDRGLIEAVH